MFRSWLAINAKIYQQGVDDKQKNKSQKLLFLPKYTISVRMDL